MKRDLMVKGDQGADSASGGPWSQGEIDASVTAYIAILRMELSGEAFVKADVRRKLIEGPLAGRSGSAVGFPTWAGLCRFSSSAPDKQVRPKPD